MSKRKPITTLPVTIRIWRKIAMTDDQRECWLWTGGLMQNGYAKVGAEGREVYVHRVVYEMAHGPIPEGFQIDHLCRVRHCCNPFHLEAVTQRENNARSGSISARHARKTHCLRGHPLTEDNLTKRSKPGQRQCIQCARIHAKATYERRKARRLAPQEN